MRILGGRRLTLLGNRDGEGGDSQMDARMRKLSRNISNAPDYQ